MPKSYRELRARMSPEAQQRARAETTRLLAELPLQGVRRAREMSQETLAESLGATQPEVSKIERRTDLYVSTLRRYVEAMGGTLDVVAHFPDGAYRITQFATIGEAQAAPPIVFATGDLKVTINRDPKPEEPWLGQWVFDGFDARYLENAARAVKTSSAQQSLAGVLEEELAA